MIEKRNGTLNKGFPSYRDRQTESETLCASFIVQRETLIGAQREKSHMCVSSRGERDGASDVEY